MTVKRIVPDIAAADPVAVAGFYRDLLDLDVVMDQGWIITLSSGHPTAPQISIASEGGSGTPVPDISIEVDNVDAVHRKALSMECEIVYALTDEPWGVRRFFIRDPAGKLLNILAHL